MKLKTTKHYYSHRMEKTKWTFWPTQYYSICNVTINILYSFDIFVTISDLIVIYYY